MKEKENLSKRYKLSHQIKDIISIKHPLTSEFLSKLESKDLKIIRAISLGEIPKISRNERINALAAIARLGGKKEGEILGQILSDHNEDTDIRAVAAVNLSFLPTEFAEPVLLKNLDVDDDMLQFKVIKSLGRIGGENSLRELDKISDFKIEFVQKQFTFAKALISYRLGLERDDLPFVKGTDRKPGKKEDLIKLTMKQLKSEDITKSLDLLEDSTFGIDLDKNFGFELNAGRAKWNLLLNSDCVKKDILLSISEQRALIGLLGRYIEETGTYSVQYVVLTTPHNTSIDIMVVRTDGEVFYSGRANIENDIMNFSISDIERPGTAPTKVTGELTEKGIKFKVVIPYGRRRNKRIATNMNKDIFSKNLR